MSVPITTDQVDGEFAPVPAPWVRVVPIESEAILIDEKEERLHALDVAGALVWLCLDGTSSLNEIAVDLAEEFGAPVDRVRSDIVGLARQLGAGGLLVNVEPITDDPCGEQEATNQQWVGNPRFVGKPPGL
jgi:hypothetical protein